ncbi:hypothetical protein PAHAL_1G133300 [Panicum hallii]|jgi:hypothetical protein|uniref:Uncharacterized protein n=1 Tax=Panicum hallii TaxID=206008 RepID=A0A2S3GPI1_9POAL|nr:hypothetical protein PAHAL_1G133300 [Panicum hallii]
MLVYFLYSRAVNLFTLDGQFIGSMLMLDERWLDLMNLSVLYVNILSVVKCCYANCMF